MTELRTGITTGSCAAAAAKAAVLVLSGEEPPKRIEIPLPGGKRISIAIEYCRKNEDSVTAAVKKDAGDDPDVTDGHLILSEVRFSRSNGIMFKAGDGVGTVTKPGLQVPPGEPAINPVPRKMIENALREVTQSGVEVTVSIPGGTDLAEKTYNPRLGIVGGLSILGTSGIVRPFSCDAIRDSIHCSLDVAEACGIYNPIIVPGRIGEKSARRYFDVSDQQVIETGNEWGFTVERLKNYPFESILVLGHPGKLAKLPAGWWDTHSSRSGSAVPYVMDLVKGLGFSVSDSHTVEGIFEHLNDLEKRTTAEQLARRIHSVLADKIRAEVCLSVFLVNIAGTKIGSYGDLGSWNALEK